MLTRTLSLVACVLLAATAQSQTITGTVRGNSGPIVGATVRLLDLDRVVRTGAQGEFNFFDVQPGTYRIFAGVTGYASAVDTVAVRNNGARVTFNLRESAIPLKEVVISASPTARTTDEQYQSTASKSQL